MQGIAPWVRTLAAHWNPQGTYALFCLGFTSRDSDHLRSGTYSHGYFSKVPNSNVLLILRTMGSIKSLKAFLSHFSLLLFIIGYVLQIFNMIVE